MTDGTKTVIVLLSAGFLILAGDLVQSRLEKERRKAIAKTLNRETAAIWYAMGKVSARVEMGLYLSGEQDKAMSDLELYKIEFLEGDLDR